MFGHLKHLSILTSLSSTFELVSNVNRAIEPIKKYKVIHWSLDNDDPSKRVLDSLHELLGDKVPNMFAPYPLYKDLDDFLRNKKKTSL